MEEIVFNRIRERDRFFSDSNEPASLALEVASDRRPHLQQGGRRRKAPTFDLCPLCVNGACVHTHLHIHAHMHTRTHSNRNTSLLSPPTY